MVLLIMEEVEKAIQSLLDDPLSEIFKSGGLTIVAHLEYGDHLPNTQKGKCA